jgi:hypothetical protein
MASIDAVHLRGGPCDGERPEPFDGDFPDTLVEIAVMDYAASVGHVYRVTADHLVDEAGVTRGGHRTAEGVTASRAGCVRLAPVEGLRLTHPRRWCARPRTSPVASVRVAAGDERDPADIALAATEAHGDLPSTEPLVVADHRPATRRGCSS